LLSLEDFSFGKSAFQPALAETDQRVLKVTMSLFGGGGDGLIIPVDERIGLKIEVNESFKE
jgi:hypothetical protein